MDIIIGRGSHRSIFSVPCADVVKRSPPSEVALLHTNFCSLFNIDDSDYRMSAVKAA